ncbi:helix-turn-helix transcriptional regulator [Pseudomonas sp. gcc21]|uniref:helix-turn-helix domain-containing protein n=1 Tax=Pseudomonas sp. gcc21 TaxID=2726989 RepID=UPI001451C5EE|nr:helix-turn-helix transcriptional regulator [Pseudomonas sp. gcc21]QJD60010.1 helix-turn-helix transcriptional regulator [Pseudomonas sp. gcc21]
MELKHAFAAALRDIRNSRKLTQEDFSSVSSRTYLSTLERGMKSPTLEKIDALSSVIGVHPLTLLTRCYLNAAPGVSLEDLMARVKAEVDALAPSST